jgi:transposase
MRRAYLTDLTDEEWECLEALLPVSENEGRPRLHSLREILDAIFTWYAAAVLGAYCPTT